MYCLMYQIQNATSWKSFQRFVIKKGLPMRVVEEGGVEGRATVAAYDWLAGSGCGCGGTSSGFSSSFCSTCSSPESKSLEEQNEQRLDNVTHYFLFVFFVRPQN